MKVVFIFFFFLLLLNIQASTNPTLRKANLLNSFQNFTIENLRSIESPNIKSYLSFLEKGVSSNIKLDSFAAIAKEYLAAQQEAKQLNESAVSHIMKKYFNVEKIAFGIDDWFCNECENVARYLQTFDNSTIVQYIENFFELLCTAFEGEAFCRGIFNEYANHFVKNLFKKVFSPKDFCGYIGFCKDSYRKLDINDYMKDVLADKPNFTAPQPTMKNKLKVLHLSDLHIDFEYEEGKNAYCDQSFCCRGENGDPTSPEQGAQYWGTMAVCDIPPRTVEHTLKFIAENVKPDLILWTGDNTSHDVWHQNITNQTRPTIFLTGLIKKYLGEIPFYPIFGNHECFPADQYDVFGNETQWLRDQTGQAWKEFLDEKAFSSLRLKGYYSSYNENFNLRVLVLDTQTCDTVNFYLLKNPTDPNQMLKWMREELYIAENNNQTVYIIGHIPPGDQFCHSQWSDRYSVLIDRFSHIIRGQFFGHTHQDHFLSMRSYLDNSLVGTVFIAPSMTTYTDQNPSFRVFEVDQETNIPVNYDQYRLNLSKVNSNVDKDSLKWDIAYNILNEYNLPDLSWNSMDSLSKLIPVDLSTRKKFIYNFFAGGTDGQLTDEELAETYTIRYYHCKTYNPAFVKFIDCLGWTFIQDPLDWFFLFLQYLDGDYHTYD